MQQEATPEQRDPQARRLRNAHRTIKSGVMRVKKGLTDMQATTVHTHE